MSELVREYLAHFFDKCNLRKDEGKTSDLHLTLNPTSLLKQGIIKPAITDGKFRQDSILSSNKSATADFLNPPHPGKSPYGHHS